jgi:hypothetical protein
MTDLDALYEKMLTYASGPVERDKITEEYAKLKSYRGDFRKTIEIPLPYAPLAKITELSVNGLCVPPENVFTFLPPQVEELNSPGAWTAVGPLKFIYFGFDESKAPEPKKPPLPEEHIVNALIGYRAWNVPLFVDELRSVANGSKWLPYQRFEAKCEEDQCNGVQCGCGIYAFNGLTLVQKEYTQEDRSRRYVYGECWLWGRVLECANGYRAQFAYPKAFINNGAIAKRMAEVFGVELLSAPISE